MFVKDPAKVKRVSIERMDYSFDGSDDNGRKVEKIIATGEVTNFTQKKDTFWESTSAVNSASLYKLIAQDEHGFVSEDYYLAPDQMISNVFKLKLGKEVMDNIVPLAATAMEGTHMYSPLAIDMLGGNYPSDENAQASSVLDEMNRWWKKSAIFYGNDDTGAITNNEQDCGYIESNNNRTLSSDELKCSVIKKDDLTGDQYCLPENMRPVESAQAKAGKCSRIVISRLQMDGVEKLGFSLGDKHSELELDMKMVKKDLDKALYTDMGIRNIECKARNTTSTFCKKRDGTPILGYWCSWGAINQEQGIAVDEQGYATTAFEHQAFGSESNAFCQDAGPAVIGAVGAPLVNLGNMKITADEVNPKGPVKVLIENGDLDLSLNGVKLNFGGSLNIGGIGGTEGGIWDGIVNGLLNGLKGVLDGLFVGIVEDVLKQNMSEFKLGFDLFTDQDVADSEQAGNESLENPSMRMQAKAYQVWTDKGEDQLVRWNMHYNGYLHSVKNNIGQDVLGSRFYPENLKSPDESVEDVDLSLNSNLINQALMSMHLSGVTHISVLSKAVDGENVFFGAGATDHISASNGTLRVELVPNTPASFKMEQDDSTGTQAQIYYRNAEMRIDSYKNGAWQREIDLQVDMRLGVLMKAVDGDFKITILGTPDLIINTMRFKGKDYIYKENDNGFFAIAGSVVKAIIQKGVDLVLNIATPQIAQNLLTWDWPALPIEGTDKQIVIKTQKLEANNGRHLQFALKVNVEDAE